MIEGEKKRLSPKAFRLQGKAKKDAKAKKRKLAFGKIFIKTFGYDPFKPRIKTNYTVAPGTKLNWLGNPLGKRPRDRLHWIRQGESYEQGWRRVKEELEARKRILLRG